VITWRKKRSGQSACMVLRRFPFKTRPKRGARRIRKKSYGKHCRRGGRIPCRLDCVRLKNASTRRQAAHGRPVRLGRFSVFPDRPTSTSGPQPDRIYASVRFFPFSLFTPARDCHRRWHWIPAGDQRGWPARPVCVDGGPRQAALFQLGALSQNV
jgi:hypothetical protein